MKPILFLLSFMIGAMLPQPDSPKPIQLREAIDIVADYDVRHVAMPAATPYYGLTDPDLKQMFIVEGLDLTQRRKVAIHEMGHLALRLRGDERWNDEDLMHVWTEEQYQRIFGGQ